MTPEPGPLSAILDAVRELLRAYVAFPSEDALVAVALWIAHAHAAEASDSTPRLALLSPEKGSGKTRCLEVAALLVPNPMHAVNMSAASLYRVVAEKRPTLLLDECDTYLGTSIAKQHEDLRGLINAGHRRGATVYRCEVAGKTVRGVEFPAYAPAALAGIGDLPDTILDRSVIVAMKRRAPNEQLERFRDRDARHRTEPVRDSLAEWTAANLDRLRDAIPEMPDEITDRAQDVWEPLVAIADAAGGDWPELARAAAVNLNRARAERDPSLGVQLLADCRRIYTNRNLDRLSTEDLVAALLALEEAPWADLRGKPLDARGLARRLRRYDVRPGDHRFPDGVRKGYRTEDLHDAWHRYLPAAVADVADVAPPASNRGEDGHVAPAEDSQGYDLHKVQDTQNPDGLNRPPAPAEKGNKGNKRNGQPDDPLSNAVGQSDTWPDSEP
jgi:hypothetical protein